MLKNIIVLLVIAVFIITSVTYAADPPLPTPVGRVIWVRGSLMAVMPNQEQRQLQKTSVIYLHDTLMTDAKSQAQIAFTDHTLMTFRPDTKFVIDQYDLQQKKGASRYIMNLIAGGFRTITGLIAKTAPDSYRVNTPVATIGVRGTDYTIYVGNGELFMGFNAGSPCVTSKGGSLCLNETNRFARVPSANAAPVALNTEPDVLKMKLDIVPAKVDPFSSTSTTVETKTSPRGTPSGTVSSFCISQ